MALGRIWFCLWETAEIDVFTGARVRSRGQL
jgi:hypothetical protein